MLQFVGGGGGEKPRVVSKVALKWVYEWMIVVWEVVG